MTYLSKLKGQLPLDAMCQSMWGSFGDGQRCTEFSAWGCTLTVNKPPLFTPFNRVIMVYSILYIPSPTWSRMAPLMGCRLPSIIGSLCPILLNMADPKKLVLANLEGLTWLLGLLTNHFQPVYSWRTLQSALFSQRQICSVDPQLPLPSLWQLSLTNTQVCRILFHDEKRTPHWHAFIS